jgi:hypothetical protein
VFCFWSLVVVVLWVWVWCSDVTAFALMLDGGSLLSGFGLNIWLSFGLWCSVVSTLPIALVVFSG